LLLMCWVLCVPNTLSNSPKIGYGNFREFMLRSSC
jgi:hypothetical protein